MSLDWQPSASLATLHLRAQVLQTIRQFFLQRGVLEVETPLLGQSCAPENHIEPFCLATEAHTWRYLQASPELSMKRLLAAGYGAIYQISKAFRANEQGRFHAPEFTLLEWYRPGWDHHALMNEVDELLQTVLGCVQAERLTYRQAFLAEADLDPISAPLQALRHLAQTWLPNADTLDRAQCLDLIFSHAVEPSLGQGCPTFILEFPAAQAALAKLEPDNPQVARRFEVYVEGVELANGFDELTDSTEQRQRFEAQRARLLTQGKNVSPLDERFLAALAAGLPDSAGVALGIDRLLMLITGAIHIDEVKTFAWNNS